MVVGHDPELTAAIREQFGALGRDVVDIDSGIRYDAASVETRIKDAARDIHHVQTLVLVLESAMEPVSLMDCDEQAFLDGVERCGFPLVACVKNVLAVFAKPPRRVLVVLPAPATDPGALHPGDAVASLNSVFAKYLTYHLFHDHVGLNVVVLDANRSASSLAGAARTLSALSSGLMDAISGQTIHLRTPNPSSAGEEP